MDNKLVFCKLDERSVHLPVYVTTAGYWMHQIEMVRPEGFPDYQSHLIIAGEGKLYVDNVSYTVGPGDLFILFPHVPHRYEPISEHWELTWVSFNGREAENLLSHAGIERSGVYQTNGEAGLSSLLAMAGIVDKRSMRADLKHSKLLYSFLLDLNNNLRHLSEGDNGTRLEPVLQYIEEQFQRPLTIAELSEVASITPQYLCRIFKEKLNIRPMAYINQERINHSKFMMFREPSMPIYKVAQLVGFEHPSYFSALFKRQEGISPEQFKKLHGF